MQLKKVKEYCYKSLTVLSFCLISHTPACCSSRFISVPPPAPLILALHVPLWSLRSLHHIGVCRGCKIPFTLYVFFLQAKMRSGPEHYSLLFMFEYVPLHTLRESDCPVRTRMQLLRPSGLVRRMRPMLTRQRVPRISASPSESILK